MMFNDEIIFVKVTKIGGHYLLYSLSNVRSKDSDILLF